MADACSYFVAVHICCTAKWSPEEFLLDDSLNPSLLMMDSRADIEKAAKVKTLSNSEGTQFKVGMLANLPGSTPATPVYIAYRSA